VNELTELLQHMHDEVHTQLQVTESKKIKVYSLGPGGASIDGTSQYESFLREPEQRLGVAQALISTLKSPG
jgi:hypothetical protein